MSEKIIAYKLDCFFWRYEQQVDTRTWKIIQQEALPFTRCRYCRFACRLRIDVHDDDDDDNAWQRGPLWPHGMGPMIPLEISECEGSIEKTSSLLWIEKWHAQNCNNYYYYCFPLMATFPCHRGSAIFSCGPNPPAFLEDYLRKLLEWICYRPDVLLVKQPSASKHLKDIKQ